VSSATVVAPSREIDVTPKAQPQRLESFAFFAVFALLLFGPLAFGAVEYWAVFTLQAGSILLFLLWAVQQVLREELRLTGSGVFLPMLGFLALVCFQLVIGQTAYRTATASTLLVYSCYGLLCFLVVQCLQRRWHAKALLAGFSLYGFVVASFALIQGITSNGKLYWIRTPKFGGWIYGPYVNHNHYAGLMELLMPFAIALFLSPRVQGQYKVMAAIAGALMASTIFICGSRGGMVAFAVQIAVLIAVIISRRSGTRTALTVGTFLVLAGALLAWVGSKELVQRMTGIPAEMRTELTGGTRLSIDRDCFRMFLQKPLTGWGLGVFPEVYPQFRSFYTNLAIDKAHNDYLQLLVETGTGGFLVMTWFLVAVFRAGCRKLKHWPADTEADLALASLLAITGMLVHSLVDFNLQIPANTALFFAMCAIVAMGPRSGRHRSRYTRHHFA